MSNKNYVNGKAREYRIMNGLRNKGYDIVIRSAGSHSNIDIVAIGKNKPILFIQSKPKSMGRKAKERLQSNNSWLDNEFQTKFIVISSLKEMSKDGY